jgi:hypothetical protein
MPLLACVQRWLDLLRVNTKGTCRRSIAALRFGGDYLYRPTASTDRQIDRLVYDLYGLTEEEIAIMQEKGAQD